MEDKVRSIDRAFDVLEAVIEYGPVNLTKLSTVVGLSKATTLRILRSLQGKEYIDKTSSAEYEITNKILQLLSSRFDKVELHIEARVYLSELRAKLGLTSHLGVLENAQAVYIEKVDSISSNRLYTKVGSTSPAYVSSIGKCILAFMENDERDNICDMFNYIKYTDKTITNKEELLNYLKIVKKCGCAMDKGEYSLDHCCISAPIFDYKGEVIAAIAISGTPKEIMSNLTQIKEALFIAAKQISNRMGCSNYPDFK